MIFEGENQTLHITREGLLVAEKSTNREIVQQQALLNAEKKSVNDLQADIEAQQSHIAEVKQESMELTTELNGVKSKLNSYVQQKADIQQNIDDKRTALTTVKKEHIIISSQIQEQHAATANLRRKMEQLNMRDKQLAVEVSHLKDKVQNKSQEIQDTDGSIDRISQDIRALQDQQDQSELLVKNKNPELSITKSGLENIDQTLADRERMYDDLNENLRQSMNTFADNEQAKTSTIEQLKKLETVISDNRIECCKRKQEYEQKAIDIVKNEKEKWKNVRINKREMLTNNELGNRIQYTNASKNTNK